MECPHPPLPHHAWVSQSWGHPVMSRDRSGTQKWWEETELRSLVLPPPQRETLGRRPQCIENFPVHRTSETVTASRGSRRLWAKAWGQEGA